MGFMRNRVYKPFEDAMKFDNLTTVVLKTPESNPQKHSNSNKICAIHLRDLMKHFGII